MNVYYMGYIHFRAAREFPNWMVVACGMCVLNNYIHGFMLPMRI